MLPRAVNTLLLICLLRQSGVCCGPSVSYSSPRVCGLRGASVILPCEYDHRWAHIYRGGEWYKEGRGTVLEYNYPFYPQCSMKVDELSNDDSGVYHFRFYTNFHSAWITSQSGITLSVTDVQLKVDSATATEGESVTLTCSTSCTLSGNPTFTWNKNGRQINTQQTGTGNRLRLNPVSSEDAGSYSCAIRGHADLPSTAVTVSVRYAPRDMSVSVTPSGEITEGDPVTLTCSSNANPSAYSYSWHKSSGGRTLQVATGQNYSITNTSAEHSGHYYCTAQNDIGVRSTDETFLNIRYSPKNTSASASPSGELPEGSSVTLTCSSNANPPVHTYTWYMKSGAESLVRGTGESISFNVTSYTSGLYYCEAQNVVGSKNSTGVQITMAVSEDSLVFGVIAEVILIVILIVLLVLGLVWLRIRQKRRSSGAETKTQQVEVGKSHWSDSDVVYSNVSAIVKTVGSAQTATAAYEDDDVDYTCLQFSQSKGHEGPVYANIHQTKPVKQHEDVEYSSVRFT